MSVFPEGTVGKELDDKARASLKEVGLDYAHGTGHGVGSYLSVHEGPCGISPRSTTVPMEPGMIISNEPGYYKEGAYGIRIENLVTVIDTGKTDDNGKKLLGFKTLTM
jgi:Xaa-Pro aminopeptidase